MPGWRRLRNNSGNGRRRLPCCLSPKELSTRSQLQRLHEGLEVGTTAPRHVVVTVCGRLSCAQIETYRQGPPGVRFEQVVSGIALSYKSERDSQAGPQPAF